ncbi:hypothetical protein QYK82_004962 [Salmonella enterica]|nr:hypothetical protein [Salmonella enterica]
MKLTSLLFSCLFISGFSCASCTIGDGNYVVCSSNEKNLLMMPDFSSGGGVNTYFYAIPPQKCRITTQVDMVSSLYINNILVQFARGCSNGYLSTFPVTNAGRNYVLTEFLLKKNIVVLSSKRLHISTFDATGFKASLDNFIQMNGGTGGGI